MNLLRSIVLLASDGGVCSASQPSIIFHVVFVAGVTARCTGSKYNGHLTGSSCNARASQRGGNHVLLVPSGHTLFKMEETTMCTELKCNRCPIPPLFDPPRRPTRPGTSATNAGWLALIISSTGLQCFWRRNCSISTFSIIILCCTE